MVLRSIRVALPCGRTNVITGWGFIDAIWDSTTNQVLRWTHAIVTFVMLPTEPIRVLCLFERRRKPGDTSCGDGTHLPLKIHKLIVIYKLQLLENRRVSLDFFCSFRNKLIFFSAGRLSSGCTFSLLYLLELKYVIVIIDNQVT